MRYFKANFLDLAHLSTWMLIIGLPIYWLELGFHKNNYGTTTPAAWIIFFIISFIALWRFFADDIQKIKIAFPQGGIERLLFLAGAMMCLMIVAVYCYASFLPPHLPQEEDVLNYHYTFPRQHLIRNSFEHISWSTFDLLPYPVQFGLAPFWFATELPNKIPQFLFLISVPALLARMMRYAGSSGPVKVLLAIFAFFGAHHVMIQGGTAMLDVVLAYLFFAAWDSLLRGNWIFAGIEFVFYFWAKSFTPLQVIVVLSVVVITVLIFKKWGFVLNWGFSRAPEGFQRINLKDLKKFLMTFFVLSIVVAGPFLYKSLNIGGTPLFPFFVGAFPAFQNIEDRPWDWGSFVSAAEYALSMKDAYGLPRDPLNFIKHLWLIAVPQQGVNNVFDYPVGLIYLLCVGPFVWFLARGLLKKEIAIMPLLAVVIWMSWWFGSQQTRFLYIPLLLIYLTVISEIKFTRVFLLSILFAVFLSGSSAFRAHRADFGKPVEEFLRPQDIEFIRINKSYIADQRSGDVVSQDYHGAYARFPLLVIEENIPYTLQIKSF